VASDGDEVDEILGTLNGALDLAIARDDLVGTYAGLRPLVAPSGTARTVAVSREHRVAVEAPGLVRVSGGKYTTYRLMARDAVDAVLGGLARTRPSATDELPIDGAAPRGELDALAARLAREAGIDAASAQTLVGRHGTRAPEVLAMGRSADLMRPLVDGQRLIEAEIAWAVEAERAIDLDDLLARRTRLAPLLSDRGAAIAPRVAAIAGERLGWDGSRQRAEVERYLAGARHEFGVPGRP
jgi:glycerol-3-phosphate dehydrogenase